MPGWRATRSPLRFKKRRDSAFTEFFSSENLGKCLKEAHMEGLVLLFLALNILFIIFVVRVWQFMARHPIIRMLHDVAFKVDIIEENERGEPSEARTLHVRIRRTQ
jgi:hypothetical protein